MIKIKLGKEELRMHGHAMPAEGELTHSRACAAATMLAFTLGDAIDEYLMKEYSDEERRVEAKVRSGHLRIRWQADDRTDEIARTIAVGYRRLAKEYPKHVSFRQEGSA